MEKNNHSIQQYRDHLLTGLLGLTDLVCLGLIIGLVIYLRYYAPLISYPPQLFFQSNTPLFLAIVCVTLYPILAFMGAYHLPRQWDFAESSALIFKAWAMLYQFPACCFLSSALGLPRNCR